MIPDPPCERGQEQGHAGPANFVARRRSADAGGLRRQHPAGADQLESFRVGASLVAPPDAPGKANTVSASPAAGTSRPGQLYSIYIQAPTGDQVAFTVFEPGNFEGGKNIRWCSRGAVTRAAERLAPGDKLALLLYGGHDQYHGTDSTSAAHPTGMPVSVTGKVWMPLPGTLPNVN